MKYLDIKHFIIPDHNMTYPEQVYLKENYRASKVFRFELNGTISYFGYDRDIIKITDISPNQDWINRIYCYLKDDVEEALRFNVERYVNRISVDEFKNRTSLLKRFNGLGFVD